MFKRTGHRNLARGAAKYLAAFFITALSYESVSAQLCKSNESMARACIKLLKEYPLVENFYFSQTNGTLLRYQNVCGRTVNVDLVFRESGTLSVEVKARGYADIPCGESCRAVDSIVACSSSTETGDGSSQDEASASVNIPTVPSVASDSQPATPTNRNEAVARPIVPTSNQPQSVMTLSTAATDGFTLRDNRDIWQHDITSPDGRTGIFDSDINACAARCSNSVNCKAFAFDRWKRVCYMKSGVPDSTLLDARSTIGVKKPAPLPNASAIASLGIELLPSWRFDGAPVRVIHVENSNSCKSACATELRCVAYTYLKRSGVDDNCQMFNISEHPIQDESDDSGFKYQSAN